MHPFTGPENDYEPLLTAEGSAPLPAVSVVIPVYNRAELLQRTLAALTSQDYQGSWEVVVADDGSEEDIAAAVVEVTAQTDLKVSVVHQTHDGYGAGRARNLGASHASGSVIVFLDADCMPRSDLVSRHAGWHTRATNLVVIGARHHVDTSRVTVTSLFTDGNPFDAETSPSEDFRLTFYRRSTRLRYGDEAFRALVSSNFSVRKDLFLSVGGFDESFNRWGGEDTELGWRLSEAGAFVIPDESAVMFHQTQIDGEDGWRDEARQQNDAQISNRIPHRFYRKSIEGHIYVRPKLTWIISPVIDARIESLWGRIRAQNFTDFETIWVGDSSALGQFAAANEADPRIKTAATLLEALQMAAGQYVATLHGWATPDHRLAARMVRRFDSRPRLGSGSVGYQLPGPDGPLAYKNDADVSSIDAAWGGDGLPVFTWVRTREWAKALLADDEPTAAFARLRGWGETVHVAEPLVALPSGSPVDGLSNDYPAYESDRSKLVADLRDRPATVLPTLGRFAKARVTRTPYQTPPKATKLPTNDRAGRPQIRYVGWVGKENFGDEIMLNATAGLMDWGDVTTAGDPTDLLLLGGGTLINRKVYLNWLQTKDSPRVERAVFGTGIANPSFWGVTEPIAEWVAFLSTCAYVGVRGPVSAEILADWGMKAPFEIVGDPALLVERPDDAEPTRPDLITISPARANGELWGESDETVFTALADLTSRLVANGKEVRFLSCFPGDDRPIFEIMRAAGHPGLPYLAAYADEAGAVKLLAESSLVVSERLHGAVLAAATGTAFVSLEYRPKLRDFARSVDMEDYVLATNDLGNLYDMVMHLDATKETATPAMDRAVGTYRIRLRAAAETIRQATV